MSAVAATSRGDMNGQPRLYAFVPRTGRFLADSVTRRPRFRRLLWSVITGVLAIVMASCTTQPDAELQFKPALLPIKFTLNSSGIDVTGEKTLVTPIGEFSIGAKYSLPPKDDDSIYVIVRNRKEGASGFDHTYHVQSGKGEFAAVVNGTTTIQVVDRQVLIDVTDGNVQSIEFKEAEPIVAEGGGDLLSTWEGRWHQYWQESFYTPFQLVDWAYDDSTMSKYYGLGFLWFLLRLVLAILLLIPDLIMSFFVLIAGVAFVLMGTTARNIVYGLGALLALIIIGFGVMAAFE